MNKYTILLLLAFVSYMQASDSKKDQVRIAPANRWQGDFAYRAEGNDSCVLCYDLYQAALIASLLEEIPSSENKKVKEELFVRSSKGFKSIASEEK